ncbi:hypothetical protein BT63DRAFT_87452 [Microthyrium microscopicum]|uniref:Zn(2)-C6 fungal-type domain-containing protein n=1 Tax=Microthyrium microscopicum TaxID=703497 RepID=A0A6A6TYQ0_9PEZI|nr:hypothetical protein BT63DRAFT_87452 [Microthyrium microscopicum]
MEKSGKKYQACDSCKRRKVRCNGEKSCQQCAHFDIPCVYTPIVRGRPRKGAATRGSVIQQCRENPAVTLNSTANSSRRRRSHTNAGKNNTLVPAEAIVRKFDKLEANFFLDLIPEYLTSVFPVNPVIDEASVRQCVPKLYSDAEATSFLYAFAAVTINLAHADGSKSPPDIKERVSALLERSLDHIRPLAFQSEPTLLKIMRNVFLEICLMGLNKNDLAFFYLREAITMLHMLGVGTDDTSLLDISSDKTKLQRAYWECFIHERFTALIDFKPTCLRPLLTLPDPDPDIEPGTERGWNQLIKTFILVDETFLNYWTGDRSTITCEWIKTKHREFEDDQWHTEVQSLNEMQQADLIITRQWLRTLTWQMALSGLLLSSNPASEMSLMLPLRLSSQLRQFLSQMTPHSVGIHGTGVLHKLVEITTTITDVVIAAPNASYSRKEILDRADDVLFLKRFLFSFPRIQDEHRELLSQKIKRMMEMYPEVMAFEQQNYNSPTLNL